MSIFRYLVPYRHIGSSSATIFGAEVYGPDRDPYTEAVIMALYRLFKCIDEAKWAFKYRYVRKHQYNIVRTDLPPGYYDEDTRMLHACMALLCQFVEWHGGPDALDRFTEDLRTPDPNAPEGWGNHQVTTQSEATAIYRWWKTDRPANHKRYDEMLHRLYGGARMRTVPVETDGQTLHEVVGFDRDEDLRQPGDSREALRALERQNNEDDQRMLHRLIDIRPGLWT